MTEITRETKADIVFEKNKVRLQIREMKKEITDIQKQNEATSVFEKIELLPEFIKAKTIFIYWSLPDELPTHDFIEKCCNAKQILLPAINENEMKPKKYISGNQMKQGLLGIFEPDLEENFDGKIDLTIVPGMAFDLKKNRLGRGKGYYDRFFKENNSFKIGICFDFQIVDIIPVSDHDFRMDKIIAHSLII